MRIVQIITSLSVGGAELLLVNSCNAFCEHYEVHVIYLKEYAPLLHKLDKRINAYHIPLNISVIANIRALLRKIEPQVIHTHLGHADIIGFIASAGLKTKLFCTMHNIWYKFNGYDKLIFKTYKLLLHSVAKRCTVICISKAVQIHVRKTLNIAVERSPLLYNGVKERKQHYTKEVAREKLDLRSTDFILLGVGRLEKQKSFETLLSAIPRLVDMIPHIKVVILGAGSLEYDLVELTKKLDVERYVKFKGVVDDPYLYFEAADVFILSSIFEGLGLVILEAFRSGLPIIASRLEGPQELIVPEKNGLLFEPGNSDDLAQKIAQLYNDKSLWAKVASGSKASFTDRFSLSAYIAGLNNLYLS